METAELLTRAQLACVDGWERALEPLAKDARYHALVEETLGLGDQRYLVLRGPDGTLRAVQPLFLLDQDLCAGCGGVVRRAVGLLRRVVPRLLRFRTLMVGCAAGEGALGCADGDETDTAALLHAALQRVAAAERARLVVLKDFPARYRAALEPFSADGYTRVPSMPQTRLPLPYASFDELSEHSLAKTTRKSLRRKFREAEAAGGLELEVVTDAAPLVAELYPLYLSVYERAQLRFERLTPEFLARIGRELPDRVRFFVWRHGGRIVAFNLCLVHDGELHDEYVGLDYDAPPALNLYFTTLRDVVDWAIAHGCRAYVSNPLAYHPKRRLRCELVPLDLYVAHTSRVANAVLARVLPLLTPVRRDPVLPTFPDYDRLGAARPRRRPRFLDPFVQLALGALLVTASELLLRAGAEGTDAHGVLRWLGFGALASGLTWIGIATYVASLGSWLVVLRRLPLAIAFPAINVVHVLIPIGARLFLGERIPLLRWGGIGLVVGGILLVVEPFVHVEETL